MFCVVLLVLSAAATAPVPSQEPPQVTGAAQVQARKDTNDRGKGDQANATNRDHNAEFLPPAAQRVRQSAHPQDASAGYGSKDAAREPLARYTWWLVLFTAIMAAGTVGAAVMVTIYTHHAKRQADAMYTQLDATNRPWISATVEVGGVFSHNDIASIPAALTLRNVGHSPAVRVNYRVTAILDAASGDKSISEGTAAAIAQQGLIEAAMLRELRATKDEGAVLWQGERTASIDISWLFNGPDLQQHKDLVSNHIHPIILGCIVYWGAHSDTPHWTHFAYHVVGRRVSGQHLFEYITLGDSRSKREVTLLKVWGAEKLT